MTLDEPSRTGRNQQAELREIEQALRTRICGICVDRNLEGPCHLEEEHECALFDSIPQIAEAISAVRSDSMEDYVAAIRGSICEQCTHQDEDGNCRVRGEVRCVLDRYLLLIVQTIEKIRGITVQAAGQLPNLGDPPERKDRGSGTIRWGTPGMIRGQGDA